MLVTIPGLGISMFCKLSGFLFGSLLLSISCIEAENMVLTRL